MGIFVYNLGESVASAFMFLSRFSAFACENVWWNQSHMQILHKTFKVWTFVFDDWNVKFILFSQEANNQISFAVDVCESNVLLPSWLMNHILFLVNYGSFYSGIFCKHSVRHDKTVIGVCSPLFSSALIWRNSHLPSGLRERERGH